MAVGLVVGLEGEELFEGESYGAAGRGELGLVLGIGEAQLGLVASGVALVESDFDLGVARPVHRPVHSWAA